MTCRVARARHHPLARRVGAARAAARGGDPRVGVAEEVVKEVGVEVVGLAQVWRPARRRPPRRELAEQGSAAQPRRELGVGAREHRARVGDAVRVERVEMVLLRAAARRRPVPRVHARPDVDKERLARAFSAARLEHRQLHAALLRALRKMVVLSQRVVGEAAELLPERAAVRQRAKVRAPRERLLRRDGRARGVQLVRWQQVRVLVRQHRHGGALHNVPQLLAEPPRPVEVVIVPMRDHVARRGVRRHVALRADRRAAVEH